MGIPCCIKYKSSLDHKAIYNSIILYFRVPIMTGPDVLEDPENKQINSWSEYNLMA